MHALIAPLIALDRVKKIVKIGLVVFELKWGRLWKLCYDSAEIGWYSFIWYTGVLKWIGISKFWFQLLIGKHFCTACEYLVRFGIVIQELYAKEVVQPESIIVTMLSSPMFAMEWGCKALRWSVSVFHKYSLGATLRHTAGYTLGMPRISTGYFLSTCLVC